MKDFYCEKCKGNETCLPANKWKESAATQDEHIIIKDTPSSGNQSEVIGL